MSTSTKDFAIGRLPGALRKDAKLARRAAKTLVSHLHLLEQRTERGGALERHVYQLRLAALALVDELGAPMVERIAAEAALPARHLGIYAESAQDGRCIRCGKNAAAHAEYAQQAKAEQLQLGGAA